VNRQDGPTAAVPRPAWASFVTPWGEGTVAVVGGRLHEVYLPWPGSPPPPAPAAGGEDSRAADADSEAAARWARQLGAYFEGDLTVDTAWTAEAVGLDDWSVTHFQRAVYRALLAVPAGATVSYGELARMAGAPRAARAVGSAMAANPAPIVVACHRVVRADGSPGHYGECDAWKVQLLRHEGAR
jgi:methylated-DNA-[protein]-cysteine S-methyltransferase